MKNLKKALSMVLASAMLFGMMVVGTGAAYADVKAEHNEEAIAVVAAAGIMGAGDSFNPDGELTRGEMAVIMTNMLDLDVKDYKGASNFTDAGWAVEYIDACYANGIMAGVSATEFGTTMKVTTAQAALMMMKALGYFQNAADFGQDWMLATVKQAAKIDLLDGIDAKADAVMTRNEVAQLALNALQADVVDLGEDATSTTITAGDVQVSISGNNNYEPQPGDAEAHYYVDAAEDDADRATQQLIEKLFEGFYKADTTDAYGRDAIEWFDDEGESIVVAGEAADYVLVATEDTKFVDLVKDNKLDKKITTEDETVVPAGTVVELWVTNKAIVDYVYYNYEIAEITEVEELDEDFEAEEIEAGAKYWVTIDGIGTVLDIQIDGFDAKTFVKDAYVVYPAIGEAAVVDEDVEFSDDVTEDKYLDVAVADSFVGKVTAKSADFIRVDGNKTNVDAMAGEVAVKTEYTFYKDVNGVILLAVEVVEDEAAAKIDEVVYLVNVYHDGGKNDKYGNVTFTYYAQVMNLKGEVEDIEIADTVVGYLTAGELYTVKTFAAKKDDAEVKVYGEGIETVEIAVKKGQAVLNAWDYDTDDYAVIYVAGDDVVIDNEDKKATINGETVRLNSKVNYILVEGVEDEIETEIKTGLVTVTLPALIEAVEDDELTEEDETVEFAPGAVVIASVDSNDNLTALYTIVPNGTVSSSVSFEDVIYVDADADYEEIVVEIDDADVDCYTFDAYTEAGKAITLTTTELYASGFYTYSVEDGIYTLDNTDLVADSLIIDGVNYVNYYETLLTVSGGVEVDAKDATWIDLHDTDGAYGKAINSLAALKKAESNDVAREYVLTILVDEDANAKVIVVRDMAIPEFEAENVAAGVENRICVKISFTDIVTVAAGDIRIVLKADDEVVAEATLNQGYTLDESWGKAIMCSFRTTENDTENWTEGHQAIELEALETVNAADVYLFGQLIDSIEAEIK